MNRILFALFFLGLAFSGSAQNIPLFQWRSHLPYVDGIKVVEVGSKIYCGTPTGLFYYDKSDNNIQPLSKTDGFSDVFIKTLGYDAVHDILFIAYQSGVIDMLHKGRITTNSDLNSNTINEIYFHGDTAFISYSGGLSIFQTLENQTNTTFGECFGQTGAYSSTILDTDLYVASAAGISRIRYNTFLINNCGLWQSISKDSCSNVVTFAGKIFATFQGGTLRMYNEAANNWTVLHYTKNKTIKSLESTNGKLVMSNDDSIYIYSSDLTLSAFPTPQQNDVIVDKDQVIWIAKNTYALIDQGSAHPGVKAPPGRPRTNNLFNAYGYKNEIWVSSGLITRSGAPAYSNYGFYLYDGETWHPYDPGTPDVRDYCGMAKDTITNHLWLGGLDSGAVDFDPVSKNISKVYYSGNTNGGLSAGSDPTKKASTVSDVCFDADDNLWVSLYRSPKQLAERKRDGTWVSYQIFTNGLTPDVNKILIDEYGYAWLITTLENNGVYIYDHVHNAKVILSTTVGDGGLPSTQVNCIAKDKTGQVWLGTSAGACVYSDPSLLFGSTKKYDVQKPFVSNGPFPGYLLAAQNVTCIAVDGANRKWFGTNNGAYLTNADGDQVIQQFTTANSPLVSNQINAIAINGVTGEVFFVTDKGIVSYRGGATDGGAQNGKIYAYPNPVKPGYNGPIAITGLVNDANVKITDINGNLVYETTALGGQAVWNGKNFSGRAASSGVYLVFITNDDGSQTAITKIMIVR